MKTIYFKNGHEKNSFLVVLTDLKDGLTETINRQYPGVVDKITNTVNQCNEELSLKIYNVSASNMEIFGRTVSVGFEYCDTWLFGRVYMWASSEKDYPTISNHVSTKLRKLFYDLGYNISSETPDN